MRVLFASPEAYPFVSTGGLSDVSAALPSALGRAGHEVLLVLPMYRDASIPGKWSWLEERHLTSAGENFGVAVTDLPGENVRVLLVSKDEYFGRKGIYGPDDESAFPDNAARFAFFCRAVTAICQSLDPAPDILHCNDWQTGLAAAYARNLRGPAVVYTIHNLRYQGNFQASEYDVSCLPESLYAVQGLEYYGKFSFMKAGIVYSDVVTTVSETYSREIMTPRFGEGMDGILRHQATKLTGILNGIDHTKWDPASDRAIRANFSSGSITPRRKCREDLVRRAGLEDCSGRMIIGMVTRLTSQKGIDLLLPVAGELVENNISMVILGTGERKIASGLLRIGEEYEGYVSVNLKFDETLARRIFAGSDLFLMPSRFEPCGLGQMIAMRYGSIPVVRKTGGLADSVSDIDEGGYGYLFQKSRPEDLLKTVLRAGKRFRDRRRWPWTVKKCMMQDNSWASRIPMYEEVYRTALEARRKR